MNEVKHIHIGRQQFTVSVEAHKELEEYLAAITKQAGEAGNDVAEEVELRMAELLTERGITESKVILPKDVKFLKGQLGEPSDFSEGESSTETPKAADETTKRLFRDTDKAMIAGVAAGLAKYFDIDPVIIRIIFVALAFAGGSGILIYVLLWLLVPEARTTSERLSMQGKAATVDNLKQAVERADVPAAARRAKGFLARTLGVVGSIILIGIGLPLAIGSGLAILGVVAGGAYILMDGFKVGGSVVAPIGNHEVVGFIAAVVTVLCIFILMMLAGIAMVRRRWQLPAWGVAALFGIFFLSASVGGALTADVEPAIHQRVQALRHTQTVQLPAFTQVDFEGKHIDFNYIPDGQSYVSYHYLGKTNAHYIRTSVKDGKLLVDATQVPGADCAFWCISTAPVVYVAVHGPKVSAYIWNDQDQTSQLQQQCMVRADMNCPVLIPSTAPVVPNGN